MIKILSKRKFEENMNVFNITDDNVENIKNTCFISINDSGEKSYFLKEHKNVLILHFDDIEHEKEGYKCFDIYDAERIIEFAEENINKNFIIHCTAGISRSGAVGTFLFNNYCKYSILKFNDDNKYISPNNLVLNILNNEYGE